MKSHEKRGQWSSNIGFIIASAGSAVGLGNLWKFPYMAGNNGGSGFVLIYLVMVMVLGFTLVLAEMTLGRYAKASPVGAFSKINKKLGFIGGLGILSSSLILSYYGVLGGWILGYIGEYIVGAPSLDISSLAGQADAATAVSKEFFDQFISSPVVPVLCQFLFMLATTLIVIRGISGGIEKASRIFMPALFILFIIVMVRSITLPGAMEGIKFFLYPDFSKISFSVVISALGQVFFSLSLAMGINITYGSYLTKESHLERNSVYVPFIDTLIALMAGLTILPAVFAFGTEPTQGPSLIFVTLPAVFLSMPLGNLFALLFFFLVFFAAITSAVALLEVPVSFIIDTFHIKRNRAVLLCSSILFLIGIPSALSFGPWQDMKIFGMSFFDFADFIPTYILLPVGGLLLSIAVGWIWGIDNAAKEISNHGQLPFRFKIVWGFAIKYIVPVSMVLIMVTSLK